MGSFSEGKNELNETKSEYIQRPKQENYKQKRVSVTGKALVQASSPKNFFNKKKGKKPSIIKHKKSFTESCESSNLSSNQMKCPEHHKELDMVCEDCLTSICSSCILFGSHKNHQYVQIEAFYQNVNSTRENLKAVLAEVKKSKKALVVAHKEKSLIPRIKKHEKKIAQGLTNFCEQVVKNLMKKKDEMLSDLKYYFKGLRAKLGKYCKESVEFIGSGDKWSETLSSLLLEIENNPESVSTSFDFLEAVKENKMFMKGQKILDSFGEMQSLLNKKTEECLQSFSVKYNHIGENLFEVQKKEVIFANDLRKKMDLIRKASSNEIEKDPLIMKSQQNINFHEMRLDSGPLDEDCFLGETQNTFGTDLMSSLNLLNEKVMKNEFDFNNRGKNKEKNFTQDLRLPLRERPVNVNFMKSQNEIPSTYREHKFQRNNILSSTNIEMDMALKQSKMISSKSNKKFQNMNKRRDSKGIFLKKISKKRTNHYSK